MTNETTFNATQATPNMTGAERLFYMRGSAKQTVCVAYKVMEMKGSGAVVKFSFSSNRVTSKEADVFNKKLGRSIATERLKADRACSTFICEVSDVRKANLQIAEHLATSRHHPTSKYPTAITKIARKYLLQGK